MSCWAGPEITNLVSAPAIFMNLLIIFGLNTQPCSSLRSIGRELSVKAEQDLTLMSNSPAISRFANFICLSLSWGETQDIYDEYIQLRGVQKMLRNWISPPLFPSKNLEISIFPIFCFLVFFFNTLHFNRISRYIVSGWQLISSLLNRPGRAFSIQQSSQCKHHSSLSQCGRKMASWSSWTQWVIAGSGSWIFDHLLISQFPRKWRFREFGSHLTPHTSGAEY